MNSKTRSKLFLLILIAFFLAALFFSLIFKTNSIFISKPNPSNSGNPTKYEFGISSGTNILYQSQAELDAELDDMLSLGIGWLRFDFDWSLIQPNGPNSYNWHDIDRVVSGAKARNIKILGILDSAPAWARSSDCSYYWCPPADPNTFATFAAAVVHRYSSQGVHNWEIWNEPNSKGFWKPSANVGAYAKLLKATYIAIKNEDSGAIILSGGLSSVSQGNGNISPTDFLSKLYENGARQYFDAVGFHPYTYPSVPTIFSTNNPWSEMFLTNPSLRSIMNAHGDASKKLWITEFGAPTGGPREQDYVSEDRQALIYEDGIKLVQNYSWAGPMFFYSYKDLGTNSRTDENFFGIIRYDGSKKPAYHTIKYLLR